MAGVYHCGPVPTLQTQVFLNLIVRLQDYPTEYLWLLPAKLRQRLLLNLPAADICWLEKTHFVDGLDMEYVWATLTKQRVPEELTGLRISPLAKKVSSMKEFYLELLSTVILNHCVAPSTRHRSHYHLALDLMFSIRGCLNIETWRKFLHDNPHWAQYLRPGLHTSSDDTVVPASRYIIYYNRGVTDTELIYLLINRCHYYPKQVNVLATKFIHNVITMEKFYPMAYTMFKEFTRKAQSLWFVARENGYSIERAASINSLRVTVRELLLGSLPRLRHLFLEALDTRTLEMHIQSIAPYFSVSDSLMRMNSYFQPLGTNLCPYTYLKELSLVITTTNNNTQSHFSPHFFDMMCCIIHAQQSLEEVSLTGLNLNTGCGCKLRRTVFTLLQHVRQPSFKVLSLASVCIPFSVLQLLMDAFLASEPRQKQNLSLHHLTILDDSHHFYSLETRFHLVMPEPSLELKELRLCHMTLTPTTLSWLFSPQHHYRLNILELHAIYTQHTHCTYSLLNAVARHSDLVVEKLYLSSLNLPHTSTSAEDFHLILSKRKLKVLGFCNCNIGHCGLLRDFTSGLTKQQHLSKPPSFQYLLLMGNRIGSAPDHEILHFFGALCSQPHLSQLYVDLRGNEFRAHHFTLLYEAWKRYACNRKMRVLRCSRNQLPADKSSLSQVASAVFV